MFSKRVVDSSLGLSVAVACATAEDPPNTTSPDSGGESGTGPAGVGGKIATAGSSSVTQGGMQGSAGSSGGGGKAGAADGGVANGGAAHAGTSSGGNASGG